ncbi:putative ankyrin repeat protein RF_0381 [Daphnia carinata]|uniref:putative ankyrin repeat protein RF_0381 n=1 Tax=Daphnia carinata TaxID=120202 RepID=UPI002579B3DE|nr:putative ankyrin repeat protein RF_0381 [Daphnia carinata]
MEMCDATLDQLFLDPDNPKKYKGRIPPFIDIFQQLATGLAYIHSKQLTHRDIKPNNVLIKRRPGQDEEAIIKWADFGLSKKVTERGSYTLTTIKGTENWYAPEVLNLFLNKNKKKEDKEAEKKRGTVKSDVFVLGLVFGYIFLEGEHLYGSKEEIHENIIRKDPVNMKKIDSELRKYYEDDLLTKMLEHDPEKRMNSTEVVNQLASIKNKLTEKETKFRQLFAGYTSADLVGRINDLIRLRIDVNAKGKYGENMLHYLCEWNSSPNLIDAIQLLIQLGIDVNAKDKRGKNVLHYLCKSSSSPNLIKAIQLLIQLGIDVNAKDSVWERNALHYLCRRNSSLNLMDAIQLLIQLGIDVNARDKLEMTALHYLCGSHSSPHLIDAIQLLIPLGIDVNVKDDRGWNALHYLCRENSSPNLTDAIQLLNQLGIDVNAKDDDGMNALHHLSESNSSPNLIDAIQLLIELGIDVNAKDNDGRNALHYLRKPSPWSNLNDTQPAIQLLIQLEIDVNPTDNFENDARTYVRYED